MRLLVVFLLGYLLGYLLGWIDCGGGVWTGQEVRPHHFCVNRDGAYGICSGGGNEAELDLSHAGCNHACERQ